ncbi:MAG: membrane protein insertion efficiency factor YidD [[Eubacterium] siraeum]|nr:membrane protein insertion efficiency factor YidD [[Eubacterium] siraeum]
MKYILIGLIKLYRITLSERLPRSCRFTPSCSQYALTAVSRFGAVKGGFLAFWRICRCNPYSPGGYDPVPEEYFFFRSLKNRLCRIGRKIAGRIKKKKTK